MKITGELTIEQAVKAAHEWQQNDELVCPPEIITALLEGCESRAALVAAGRKVLDGLNARIQRASEAGGVVPVFDGIAELHDALPAALVNEGTNEK